MKIISGKVIAAERVLLEFNNKKAYHATSQKVSIKFLLDDGETYWSDNYTDNFKVGSYVEFYGEEDCCNTYINQQTAKALIKRKRMNIIERCMPLVANILGLMITYIGAKIVGNSVSTELVLGLCITFIILFSIEIEVYRMSDEPKGKDVKRLKEYIKGYNHNNYSLTQEDISRTSSVIKEKINLP